MKNDAFDRRTFLKSAVAGSAAAVIGALPQPARAQGAPVFHAKAYKNGTGMSPQPRRRDAL